MDQLVDSNPVAVYKALKDIVSSQNKLNPFIPCKQKPTTDYILREGDNTENFAKYIKRDDMDRKRHQGEDISFALSPYKNRITIADSY